MSGVMNQWGPVQSSDADHGFVPRRRRGEALLVQHIAGLHLQRAGMSHITDCHDVANAFFLQQLVPHAWCYAQDVFSWP
eukprot:2849431-Pyramimonas_sp.AAC.1